MIVVVVVVVAVVESGLLMSSQVEWTYPMIPPQARNNDNTCNDVANLFIIERSHEKTNNISF